MAVGERGTGRPGLERLLIAPSRVHEVDVAVVGRPEQLEGLESRRRRHLPGAGREPLLELRGALAGHRDGIDPDDAHAPLLGWTDRSPRRPGVLPAPTRSAPTARRIPSPAPAGSARSRPRGRHPTPRRAT